MRETGPLTGVITGDMFTDPFPTGFDAHLYSHGVFTVDPSWKGPPPPKDRFVL